MVILPRFYVYVLARPAKGKTPPRVFYVGKGSKRRAFAHEGEARRGHKCHKCNVIRKVWREGGEIEHYILLTTDNEQEAYAYEQELIAMYDIETLTNQSSGGASGNTLSDETRAKMSVAHKGIPQSPETRAKKSALAKERLADPVERERFLSRLIRPWTPEERQRRKAAMRETWQDTDVREKRLAGMRATAPERNRKAGESLRRHYADPVIRQQHSERMKLLQTPEVKERARTGIKRSWDDADIRARRIEGLRRTGATAEFREKVRQNTLLRWGYIYHLCAPDGELFTTTDLAVFCAEHELIYRSMQCVMRGERREHKGWTGTREKPS